MARDVGSGAGPGCSAIAGPVWLTTERVQPPVHRRERLLREAGLSGFRSGERRMTRISCRWGQVCPAKD